jgi:hypothetical protein
MYDTAIWCHFQGARGGAQQRSKEFSHDTAVGIWRIIEMKLSFPHRGALRHLKYQINSCFNFHQLIM